MKEFKLIVAGGRDFKDYSLLCIELCLLADGIYKDFAVSVVSGMANGADLFGHNFAKENDVVVYEFPANWEKFGKRAGFIRNQAMGNFADGLLAFWDGESRGTGHMINYMESLGKPFHIVKY